MDAIQANVAKSLPPLTIPNAVMLTAASALYWFLAFIVMHYVMIKPFMQYFGKTEWVSHFNQLSDREQKFYTSFWHGIYHAVLSTFFAAYCFVYADGTPGTTWFSDSYYKLHMFEVQKYSLILSIGYFCYDFAFCLLTAEAGGLQM